MNKIFRIVWSQATQSWVVVSELTKAHKKQSSSNAQKSAVKFSGNFIKSSAVALALLSGHSAYAALNQAGTGSDNAVALGEAANANQARAIAIGKGATISSGQDTIAIGTDTKAKGHTSIVIGKNAKTTNDAEGTVVIGRDAFSEGSGNGGRPNTVVGRGAYTAFGENGTYRLNAATALGFQAGAGLRTDPSNGNKLVSNETNADNNAEVLVKAGYGLDENAPADTKTALQGGNVNNNLTFYRKKHINEATAIGAEARAIGDQSIAIGGQVVAGDGVVALGGNDTDQLRNNKYQVVTADAVNKTNVGTIDDYNLAYTESTNTVAEQYKKLVGRGMPTAYKSTYGQSGSVVIGMEAHSTTALGTAIGTNSVVRMGAFGATAIGAGSTVQANAEAAVAIGMGSVANGAYALAGGTASWAEYGDIALGYQAKASGKDGAIAMGRATNAQGDSSIMIGGANIESAAAQNTSYEKANGQTITKSVTEKINGKNVTREYSFAGTTKTNGSVAEAYKELTGLDMNKDALDFVINKNGHASTSLGVHALAKGDLGTAIGASSRAEAIGSVALGTGAHATRQNAVAIGTGSTTELVGTRQLSVNYDSDGNIVSDNSKDIAYTFKWAGGTNTAEGDVVSFGSSGAERQLKNVAAGRVAEDSTDAINGSQLNSITKKIAAGFNTSGNVVTGSSGEFTSKKANTASTKADYETSIRSEDKVQFQVGNNLKLDRDETEGEIDVPDDFDKTKTVKKKIRKADFAYSLNPVLTNLTSAEFIGTGTDAPTTKLTNEGVTITPVGKSSVSLTQNGLDNGGNPITNVAGNLDGAKANTTAPTTKADKPSNVDGIKNNAATVGDVLNAGWNLQEKGTAKDFVTAYDTVNFVDGDGTTVSVENTDGKISKIKYSVNTGNGLQKDPTGNTISVKPADNSLEVTNNGVKVKAADNTLTTDANGLKVNTGNITASSVPTVADADKDKIATVGNVADAIKAAAWKATSDKTANGENTGKKDQEVKAGDTVTFEADKNIKIAQADGKFTFSTKDKVEFKSIKVGEDKDGKKPVNLTTDKATDVSNNDPANKPTTALNVSSDGKPTQITGVGSVLNTEAVPTIPAGTATTGNGQPKLVNLGTGHNQTALGNNVLNAAATVRDLANMGWVVSSDKTTDGTGEYKDVVKNANEVKFVGKNAAKVSGKTENGVRTITIDVPDVKTAELVSSKDGSVIAPSTNPELQKALKAAKDELAAAATPEQKEAAEKKVKDAETELNKALNDKGVATAKNVADMINASGFTLKTSNVDGGEKVSGNDEVINPGKAVEMIAGKNLTVKQEANGKVTYATKDEVEFNTVKVGGDANTYVDDKGNPVTKKEDGSFVDAKGNTVDAAKVSPVAPVTLKTEKASPANNNAEGNHPTTALNISSGTGADAKPTQLKGVGSVLNTKAQPTSTGKQGDTPATEGNQNLVNLGNNPITGKSDLAPEILNSAATVGDLANMGWVVSTKDGNGYTDVVKNANQVDFKGTGLATVTGETDKESGIRTITVNVDAQKTVEAAQTPVVYTNKDGDKLVKVGDKFYKAGDVVNGKPKDNAQEVPKGDVIASMNNGDNKTNKPMQLANIGSNLPTVNDTNKQAFDPNSTEPKAGKDNKSAPITAKEAADIVNKAGNNAATVSDVLNAGWNLKNNGEARDFVKPYDTVNFINGKGTVAVVETADDAASSTVKFDVDAGEITSNTNGSVNGPTTVENAKKLADDLKKAEQAVKDLPADATPEAKKAAQDALKAAQDAAAPLNKVATAQNVADMINASGFTLKTSNVDGGEKVSGDDEVINPGKAVEMIAGKNLTVKQEANGKVTYSTKDDVEFNTVKLGDAKDGKAPVNMKTEAAKPATNNGADQPTTALNFTSGEGDKAKPTQLTGVGSTLNTQDIATAPQGKDNTNKPNVSLVNLVGTDDAPVNKNAAATVGDLQNMGWVVSTKDGNGYKDVVKNANQVDFKGTGLATVTGETDKESGIRTITVNVDAQKTVEAAQTPVVYTNKAGDKLVKVGDKFYKAGDVVNGKPKENAQEVPKGDVIASMNNGDNNTSKPMQLANIGSNLPTVNDTNKQAFDPNSTTPKAGKDNKSAPITAKEAADIVNKAGNNAATVSDVLNAGWNLQNNGEARDFVKPYDTVNFINGKGTVAVVETADDAASSTVKFDVDTGEITSNTNGSVNGPTTAENAKKLADDLKKAEQAVKDLPADATEDKKAEAQKALKDAQDAAAPLNKVATAQNVADMINASGFTLKTSNVEGGEKDAASTGDEVINPGKAVEMVAGKNLTVKQEANGKVTYSTKDDVSFNTVNVGDNTYVDADGKPVTKNADGTYTDSKGQPIEEGKVTKLAPVAMKAEKAKPATNNGNKAEDQPTTALNVSSSDGKPTQITGVGSTLNVKPVDTNPNGTPTTGDARPNLVDLVGTKDAPVNKNAAATVGDLQNMGWVVSTKDGNGYTDVVKNANQVDFKGGPGISVKGTTTTDGVREITISVKDGEVIKPNQFTAKVNGTDTPVTKVGDQYYNTADIDPKTGEPKANVTPVTPDAGTTPTNAGDGYVTGNKVAAAIQKSGFVVGKQKDALSAADFKDEDEKVNPDDELRFADGNNTKVKLATKESVDKDGNKVTTTTVKVDVTGLPVQYTDKNGTPVTKVGDKYFTVDDKGNPTATEVKPADLTTNMVNPAAAPNEIGAPTTLGNVKSNLPSVNDADKNAKDAAGNPIAGKDNKSAPITAAEAAELLNPKTADGKANPKFAGNNAATVSDVLNTGWNLQNNGEAKDFVKPYDTVNFVDGKGTKAVVETTPNGITSNVKFDIDTGKITNNDDGSVQGPVTPEMTKALEDATNALNSLPPTAPAAVIDAAKKAVADAANNIANVANKVATAQDVANAINKSGFTLTTSANGGEKISGTPEMINPGKKVEMVAGKNMTVKQESNGKVTYATASNVTFDSVQFGDKGPKITNKAGNINVSGPDGKTPTKITGVAPGEISATSKDAINGSQLHAVASNLNNKINKVGKHADAGTASALAAANIPQAYTPGKSLVGIAAGNYQGQNGLAVGMSRISDNGKIIIRLSGTANSQGKTGVAAGVGYQW
ncbi:YadA-like family protein [Haemophilus parainfluenzae]|uniref:Hsf-like protein n=1 Tax=Haemophilus parainfluenzae TaxID=729 RepID=A0A377JH08_HAEPA|nr:YadA-like family protein [Haemophilus parainfluenzae]STP02832.1 Hsf-like protein [Haemophilus parainfluenzae]